MTHAVRPLTPGHTQDDADTWFLAVFSLAQRRFSRVYFEPMGKRRTEFAPVQCQRQKRIWDLGSFCVVLGLSKVKRKMKIYFARQIFS